MNSRLTYPGNFSRREFIRTCAAGTVTLASGSFLGNLSLTSKTTAIPETGPALFHFSLDQNWLFGQKFREDAIQPAFDDRNFSNVTLPHSVCKLSWQNWNPAEWENMWIYRRHFDLPRECEGMRLFLIFDGVMVGTTPVINGHPLSQHLGGYLPSRYEITEWVKKENNVLAVEVDSRWSDVPPEGSPEGPKRVDYLEPGGIFRSVTLQAVPQIFIEDVFAKPVGVMDAGRRVEVRCSIDSAVDRDKRVELHVELREGEKIIASSTTVVSRKGKGQTEANVELSHLGNVKLWDVDSPTLYDVVASLLVEGIPVHEYRTRIGLRDARFELDGFFLNGRRLQLFGLNRHELFPYVGFAMPPRVMRHDAEILKREFNCNIVRCSHYPQSEAFLDACDELGLLVWEEVPGWGYIGDEAWKKLLARDVREMIIRDRNHPSIIIWGTRANESPNDVELYKETRQIARSLDDSRPSSGSMTEGTRKTWEQLWHEDVFAFDDYHADAPGQVGILDPVPGYPYMLAEAVGQYNYGHPEERFNAKYRRAGDLELQQSQALFHAQAHDKAAANPRNCGVIAWCAFDYASLINSYNNVKCPGVADVFRIPKLGASFYQSQVDPKVRPVIVPDFYWDFGAKTPFGPGKNAAIFSNCDRLDLFIGGKLYKTLRPDSTNFSRTKYPPFFVDFDIDAKNSPDLRIDGYVGSEVVVSKSFSSDSSQDMFVLTADDRELIGDGSDATRLEFKVTDKFGTPRFFGAGTVALALTGPGQIVGDNSFSLEDSGGVGAVWVKTISGGAGSIKIDAAHSTYGTKSVTITVTPEDRTTKI
ncbi:MAG TPA: glycoside hydrolase family 2 TIM barrel-domain containing protein [Bacteroidota bacterium]|nr:glycoside hydrolase family 2 TIM barrel-domain containing protein [Bacteroidota bacterium]